MEIKINIQFNGKTHTEVRQEVDDKVFEKINKICIERKADIVDLLINDIEELTPEEAEEIVTSWDI